MWSFLLVVFRKMLRLIVLSALCSSVSRKGNLLFSSFSYVKLMEGSTSLRRLTKLSRSVWRE